MGGLKFSTMNLHGITFGIKEKVILKIDYFKIVWVDHDPAYYESPWPQRLHKSFILANVLM